MAITKLDDNTALIVIDLQYGIVALPEPQAVQRVINNANRLIEAFHHRHWPVVLVNVSGRPSGRTDQAPSSGGAQDNGSTLIDDLIRYKEQLLITKRTWGAFSHTDLHVKLQGLGVTQVVIVGIATSMGVESTAMQAYELGYNVTLCTDAMTDVSPDNHTHAIRATFPKLAETGITEEVLTKITR
ncbi:cysteine hydrolase family protein [Shewanella sp. 125m-7]